jgi:hypothetical protein
MFLAGEVAADFFGGSLEHGEELLHTAQSYVGLGDLK